jgi:outer membrane protein
MAGRHAPGLPNSVGAIVAGVFALLFAGLLAAQSSSPTRIGYVDMRRLIDNAPQVAESKRKLAAEFASKDQSLKSEEARLATLEARERKDGTILPKPVAESLHREITALRTSVERTRKRLSDELRARQDEEYNRQWPRIEAAVIAHARENKLDLIVQAPVLYASAQIDITDAVLARLKRDGAAEAPR